MKLAPALQLSHSGSGILSIRRYLSEFRRYQHLRSGYQPFRRYHSRSPDQWLLCEPPDWSDWQTDRLRSCPVSLLPALLPSRSRPSCPLRPQSGQSLYRTLSECCGAPRSSSPASSGWCDIPSLLRWTPDRYRYCRKSARWWQNPLSGHLSSLHPQSCLLQYDPSRFQPGLNTPVLPEPLLPVPALSQHSQPQLTVCFLPVPVFPYKCLPWWFPPNICDDFYIF